ncbi:hypothetical protein DFH08DRAFT_971396 [Mycena albidolilacea]|uniref:Uncharacterized protein n=1 Tax=Mycena albidolilacea TaxID=1033008 RepID=A0AAD6ZDG3_9AGAR|nr:hypothetical protein DFH08DRAFT_971396 [Mycena albidolilacea]
MSPARARSPFPATRPRSPALPQKAISPRPPPGCSTGRSVQDASVLLTHLPLPPLPHRHCRCLPALPAASPPFSPPSRPSRRLPALSRCLPAPFPTPAHPFLPPVRSFPAVPSFPAARTRSLPAACPPTSAVRPPPSRLSVPSRLF